MRVLHVVSSKAFAGTERHALCLVAELRELGCAAELVCPPAATTLRAEARIVRVPVQPGRHGKQLASAAIFHAHDGRSAIFAALLAKAARAFFIRTQHFVKPASVVRPGWRGSFSIALHRSLNRRLDGYIAVSQAVADAAHDRRDLVGVPLVVIAPGVGVPTSTVVAVAINARERAACPVVTSVGRLEAERRFDVLLEAIPQVLTTEPQCRFVIAGSGSEEGSLRLQARRLGVEHAITWTGWLPTIDPVLSASHVYVNTWPWEGYGMATAEAMAFGLPVIATRSGASTELVQDEVTGRLVAPEDPVALGLAICELVQDRSRAAAMGYAGRQRAVDGFSARQTAISTLAFYKRLLES